VLALAEMLEKLAAEEPRVASVVDLVFFGGLKQEEVAKALGVSLSSVERDLRFAKTWLRLQLRDDGNRPIDLAPSAYTASPTPAETACDI
jgi:DNA-directed RNA polymerase specialized sigma24 family protein